MSLFLSLFLQNQVPQFSSDLSPITTPIRDYLLSPMDNYTFDNFLVPDTHQEVTRRIKFLIAK